MCAPICIFEITRVYCGLGAEPLSGGKAALDEAKSLFRILVENLHVLYCTLHSVNLAPRFVHFRLEGHFSPLATPCNAVH